MLQKKIKKREMGGRKKIGEKKYGGERCIFFS
jgi:hypothetical protein